MRTHATIFLSLLLGCSANDSNSANSDGAPAQTEVVFEDDSDLFFATDGPRDTDISDRVRVVNTCSIVSPNLTYVIATARANKGDWGTCDHDRYNAHSRIEMRTAVVLAGEDPGETIDVLFTHIAPPSDGEHMILGVKRDQDVYLAAVGVIVNTTSDFHESRTPAEDDVSVEFELPTTVRELELEVQRVRSGGARCSAEEQRARSQRGEVLPIFLAPDPCVKPTVGGSHEPDDTSGNSESG